jgi:hypothetical protein
MGLINHKVKKYATLAPGPGAYAPNHEHKETSIRYTMRAITANKDRDAEKSRRLPGPGNYEPTNGYNSLNKYNGHTKFGKSTR